MFSAEILAPTSFVTEIAAATMQHAMYPVQGSHSPVMIKFPDLSGHFK